MKRAMAKRKTDLLAGKRVLADMNTIRRALRERWPIPEETRSVLLERLKTIIEKPTVQAMSKDGPVSLDGPADANAVRAASVLVAMMAQNQADDHLADKNQRLDEGKATERVEGIEFVVIGKMK